MDEKELVMDIAYKPYYDLLLTKNLTDTTYLTNIYARTPTDGSPLSYEFDVKKNDMYNPFETILVDEGVGSNAYRDKWQLFDQIILSKPFMDKNYKDYQLYKAGVFNKSFLINKKGKFKGYPFRSFSYGTFTGGYSDHLPPYIYLLKEIK